MREAHAETRAFIARPQFRILMTGGILITALAGPFHTLQLMSFPVRLLYWAVIIFLAGLTLSFLSMYARVLNAKRMPWPVTNVLATIAAFPLIFGLTVGLDLWLMGPSPDVGLAALALYVFVPMLIINLIVNASLQKAEREAALTAPGDDLITLSQPEPANIAERPVLLFERLPSELGQELICLRAQNHYLEAMTTRGSATILMRLSDAEAMLPPAAGLRVHRSWWVNLDHVIDMARTESGGMELTTSNGLAIPVGRGQRAALRAMLDQRQTKAAE